jgi:glycosyltransferase involved in cell wall biosynthesis
VALVGTYPPTRCGIATFTRALADAWTAGGHGPAHIVRVMGDDDVLDHDSRVIHRWRCPGTEAIQAAAAAASRADVVVVQHEYGIYRGDDGGDVVELVARLRAPCVVVLHTAVAAPTARQRLILEQLASRADALVVQSHSALERVVATTAIAERRITVIPHGAAHVARGPEPAGDGGREVLTWGLLGPGKGIEHAIRAVAELRDIVPRPHYTVAGETHPKVRARDGEAYRDGLIALSRQLGIERMVTFDDRYRTTEEVLAMICAADIALLPYDSRDQVTSGVLVEALAAGCPVIATAFPHAVEMLASGAGMTVPHEDPGALARALRTVVTRPRLLAALRRQAEAIGGGLDWGVVADRYAQLADAVTHRMTAA